MATFNASAIHKIRRYAGSGLGEWQEAAQQSSMGGSPGGKISDGAYFESCSDYSFKGLTMLAIGALAEKTGTNIETIRYYEKLGILPVPERTEGNQRRYSASVVSRLRFIRHARELGFSLDAIREFIDLSTRRDQSCTRVDAIAREHLADVERKIAMLKGLKIELSAMINGCERGTVAKCRIIEALADHGRCKTGQHKVPHAPGRPRRVRAERAARHVP